MKLTFATMAGGLLLGATTVSAATQSVGICNRLTYADGGLYCRRNSAGVCLADLGDFPVQKSFPLSLYMESTNGIIPTLYLAEQTDVHRYNRYNEVLYLDTTPGKVSAVGFAKPSALTASQKASYWFQTFGILLWTPTTNVNDGTPISKPGVVAGTGFQLVEVPGHPGVFQQFWNQTLFDQMRAGGHGNYFMEAGSCGADTTPVITDLDHP